MPLPELLHTRTIDAEMNGLHSACLGGQHVRLGGLAMEGVIRTAVAADAAAITALRQAEYSTSHEFTLLSASSLAWGPDDEFGLVLAAVRTDGTIVSTMRARIFASKSVFERSSGLDLSPVELPAPTWFLDRASTHAGFRKCGLNAMLRYHLLKAAAGQDSPSVSGWLFSGVSRTKTMVEIGYCFTPVTATQPRGYRHMESPGRDYVVAVLPHAALTHACRRLEQMLGGELERWPWTGPELPEAGMVS